MRSRSAFIILALVAACAPKEAPKPAAPPPPPAATIADFAGTWQVTATITGAAKPVASVLAGTAADSGWSITLEGRPKMALTVSMSGDSLIAVSPEYESVLRKGVKVTTRIAGVMKNGQMEGNVVATYKTAKGDEVVPGTFTGTKAAPK